MSRMDPRETCANCRWWAEDDSFKVEGREPRRIGECRVRSDIEDPSRWGDFWCGEFYPDFRAPDK